MRFSGLQKLTLLDYPGTVACTLFTAGCNFRCPFCHNALLVTGKPEESLSEEQILDFLQKRQGMLEGVAITGGEPLLHEDLPDFLEKVRALGYRIKLDTNGTRPELLKKIVSAGLVDRVAMDIKNDPARYGAAVGLAQPDMDAIGKSKDFLMTCGVDYEFRTTVVKGIHREPDILAMAKWIAGAREYYLQQYKDSGELIAPEGLSPFTEEEMKNFAEVASRYVPNVSLRGI